MHRTQRHADTHTDYDREPDCRDPRRDALAPWIDPDDVRRQYPDAGQGGVGAPYCVGQALRLALGLSDRAGHGHPPAMYISMALFSLGVDEEDAAASADDIVRANDAGLIDRAWEHLAAAMRRSDAAARAEIAEVIAWRALLEPAPGPWLVLPSGTVLPEDVPEEVHADVR
ncbi:MAG: hypothetical protein IT429_00875 [Gemmataceae bacterium]|nr:hypothetical protein [Gemmataceae bacterium]